MAIRTFVANVTSPGDINHAMLRLEGETRAMHGTSDDRSAEMDVDVVGDLDIMFFCNALFGTRWKLTIAFEGEEPFFKATGTTDTKNSSLLVKGVQLPG